MQKTNDLALQALNAAKEREKKRQYPEYRIIVDECKRFTEQDMVDLITKWKINKAGWFQSD